MEYSTTVRAETVDKAVKIGLTKLDITADEATINIISEGKKGLFGFGKQDAIVEIAKNEKISYADVTESLDVTTEEDVIEKTSEASEEPVEEVAIETEDFDRAIEEVSQNNLQDRHENVAKYLEDVIRDYGADAKITVATGKNQVIFNIETDKSGLIIGKHGKIINALQILAQIMVFQYDKRRQSIILNIGDYRDRRSSILEQIAERTAKEVLRTKRSVVLDPLPSYERKQIHAYLSKVDHIETYSEGRDPNRYLVVEYKA